MKFADFRNICYSEISCITMKLFEEYPFSQSKLFAFFSTKKEGNMSTRYGDISSVFERRAKFLHQNISNENRIIHIRANHKAVIRTIPNDIVEEIIECDGIISCNPQMYFSIAFGDCLPLVVYDPNKHIFAYAHCSYKSINQWLHTLITESLIRKYWCDLSNLQVLIGPCIKAHSLELDDISALDEKDWRNHIMVYEDGTYNVDLISRVVTDLSNLGIIYTNIYRSIRDTWNDDNLFSHYRSTHLWEEEWRFLFCVGLKQ